MKENLAFDPEIVGPPMRLLDFRFRSRFQSEGVEHELRHAAWRNFQVPQSSNSANGRRNRYPSRPAWKGADGAADVRYQSKLPREWAPGETVRGRFHRKARTNTGRWKMILTWDGTRTTLYTGWNSYLSFLARTLQPGSFVEITHEGVGCFAARVLDRAYNSRDPGSILHLRSVDFAHVF